MKKGWHWPLLLVALMAAFLVPNFILVYLATSDPSFAVEEDYYQKALAWDATMEQRRENEALGWIVDLSVEPAGPGRIGLVTVIRDREGHKITGATVRVETFHNARASEIHRAVMAPREEGYEASVPIRRPGLWEIRLEITKDDDRFTYSTLEEVVTGP